MTDDAELLRHYAEHGTDDAFTELVRRHLDLVWGTARRVSGDADLARDVAQTVFADLARKARRLPRDVILAGWLYRAACHAAAKAVRGNARRAQRERQAMEFHSVDADETTNARAIEALQPLLDEALGQLGEADRDAVVLRFFARKSLAEVGAALGTTGDTAQKRLSRALEKLRHHFRRRGVGVSGVALAAALGAAGAQAAPAGLTTTIAIASLAVASASGATATIANTIALMKTKLALAALALAVVATPLALQQKNASQLREQNRVLQQQTAQLEALRDENAGLANLKMDAAEMQRLRGEHAELLRLRGEVGRLRRATTESNAGPRSQPDVASDVGKIAQEKIDQLALAKAISQNTVNAMKQLGLAARLFAQDHDERFPATFDEMKHELSGWPLDGFEFVQHARPVNERDPDKLLFRERAPRQLPDGKWARVYTMCDGSVREQISDDGNFEAWESEHLVKDAAEK